MLPALAQLPTFRDQARVSRPCIVVEASIGFVLRNYLLADCLTILVQSSDVHVLSPLGEQEHFREVMDRRATKVSLLKSPLLDPAWERLRKWQQALHVGRLYNETWKLKMSANHHEAKWSSRTWNHFTLQLARLLQGQRATEWVRTREERRALQSLEAEYYRQLYAKIRPSIVFSAAPLIPDEWLPIQVARSLGIPTVLAVLSWDNLSSKLRLPLPVSAILVWSEGMRRELLKYYPEVRPEQVHITGAPQFDYYVKEHHRESRETFFTRIGLDPARKVILYSGVTPSLMPEEPKVVENLMSAIRSGAIAGNPQLLVRLHPKDDGSRYREFRSRYPEVMLTIPGERSRGRLREWQPDEEDIRLLVNTVSHSDVQINVASTMTIDAAVMDRPVINVVYDFRPPGSRKSWGLCIYECTHYLPIPETGGVRMARSPEDLVRDINTYLADPSLDQEGRRRMVELICGTVDGNSGKRVAEKLRELCGPLEQ